MTYNERETLPWVIRREAPADNQALRAALYEGAVFHLPASATTRAVVSATNELLRATLGEEPRAAQFRLGRDALFQQVGALRRALYLEERWHTAARAVMAERGFAEETTAFDPLRLRVVMHDGDRDPQAAPVYYAHRDTWYAHPQCQLTWWIALHDVTPEETFHFFPDWFARAVPNNSEIFNYDDWVRDGWDLKIGWQRKGVDTAALYPGQTASVALGAEVGFAAQTGDLILFSGQHFHRTRPNHSGLTRFSLDFRSADLQDAAAGRGAPNADNRSRGSVLRDYLRAGAG